jgi:hypothetical protein
MIELKQVNNVISERGIPDKIYITDEEDYRVLHAVKKLVTVQTSKDMKRYPKGAFVYGRERVEFQSQHRKKKAIEETES